MTKKIAFSAFLLGIFFMSCKKDRTCSCTLTRTGTNTTEGKVEESFGGFTIPLADTTFSEPFSDTQIYKKKIINSTKSAAKNNCVSYSQPYKQVTRTSVPDSTFSIVLLVTNSGEEKVNCELD